MVNLSDKTKQLNKDCSHVNDILLLTGVSLTVIQVRRKETTGQKLQVLDDM